MKVLYIAAQRSSAEQAASALRSVGPNLAVIWAANLADARRWIGSHRNFAVLVVEVESDDLSCAVFVRQVRSSGVTAPVIVVSVQDPAPSMLALRVVADQIVSKGRSFLNDLPYVVSRALHTGRPAPRESVFADVAGGEPLPPQPPAPPTVPERPASVPAPISLVRSDRAETRDPAPPVEAEASRSRTDEAAAGPRPAARQDASGARGWIEAELVKEITRRKALEQELAAATLALKRDDDRRPDATAAAEDPSRHAALEARLAAEEARREAQAGELAAARAALQDAEARHAQQLADAAARLNALQTRATARQVEAAAALETLHARLTDRADALQRTEQQAALDRQAAADDTVQIRADLHRELGEETARRQALTAELAAIETARQHADQRYAAELEAVTARFLEYQSHTEARLAEAAEAVVVLESTLAERAAALASAEERAAADRQQTDADRQRVVADAVERVRAIEEDLAREVRRRQALEWALSEETAARQRMEQQQAAEVTTLTGEFAEYRSHAEFQLAEASAAVAALEATLAGRAAALARVEEQIEAARHLARAEAAERQDEFDVEVAREAARRHVVEAELAAERAARQQVEYEHAAECAALAERLTDFQTHAGAQMAEAAATVSVLQVQLADRDAALGRAAEEAAADRELAAAERIERRREFEAVLARETNRRQALEGALAEQEAARQDERRQHAAEISAVRASLAEHQRRAEAELAATVAALRIAETQAEASLRAAEARAGAALSAAQAQFAEALHAAEERAAADQHAAEAQAARQRHEAAAALQALEEQAARERHEAAAALQAAEEHAARERHEAAERAARRQTELAAEIRQELARRQTVEAELGDVRLEAEQAQGAFLDQIAELSRRAREQETRLEERAARERAEWEATLARQQDRLQQVRSEYDLARQYLAASQDEIQRVSSAGDEERAQAASARQAIEAELTEVRAAVQALQAELDQSRIAAEAAREQNARARGEERAALDAVIAARDTQLREQAAERQAIAAALAAAETRLRATVAANEAGQRTLAELEERAVRERAEWESTRTGLQERLLQIETEHDLARQYLAASQDEVQQLSSAREDERVEATRTRLAIEAELTQARAALQALHATLDETRASAEAARDREARMRGEERAALEAEIVTRDTRLRDQAAEREAAAAAAAGALAGVETRLRAAMAQQQADQRAIADLERQRASLAGDLESTRSQRESLRLEAERVPPLLARLEDTRAAAERQFEESPVSLCRCRPDGGITKVNRAMTSLLGYRNMAELERVDFAAAVFESGAELPWIVERRLASGSTEAVETTWRRKDRRRILVRLQVVARTADGIDLAAEDITAVRSLEERLRTAQRMEAVARYASEVAATCERLLRDVSQEGQEWVASLASDGSRYHGELLLDEVTRAAGLLGQLSVYGQQQQQTAALVDVTTVLRDLGPVLKRVAGDEIDLVLPRTSSPIHVELEAHRLERILVNVAAYGRGRMRSSGRLMIEVAGVTPDQEFTEKYPNVRPGPHVLLTVTEVRRSAPPDIRTAFDSQPAAGASEGGTPGVDLGTLQELVNDCGGHLWMAAEPTGDMVLKIHLPRRVLDDLDPPSGARPFSRPRWIDRLAGVRH